MDIEGAELELLESMIEDQTISLIDILYVEFHSEFQRAPGNKIAKAREDRIISHITEKTNVKLRLWH